ncbi:Ubiquitin carboxyl-terminal hydrolase [Ooceraea biroi]|uniref:Ubiquitin carboxyl-terminal hydrolase n=1 Tax=Ooceraea biroi TaxID=2015173 RepID=A0A026X416_OOCBI|nr:Ubiquitin carboxyl-terminal hydrolase [Ooceraea biroi]
MFGSTYLCECSFSKMKYIKTDKSRLGQYSDLYLKTDVFLLADVFENFRNTCIRSYGLDPVHYYTLPGYTWDAMLLHTGIEFELLTDVDIVLFVERGVRGGLSQCSHRYARANNGYAPSYDPSELSTYLMYYDLLVEHDRAHLAVKAATQLEKPRYVIFALQTGRRNIATKDASLFDECDLSNVKLFLNSEFYPYDDNHLDFTKNRYAVLYDMYARFRRAYYALDRDDDGAMLTLSKFLPCGPLVVRNKRTKETLLSCLTNLFYNIATQEKKVGSIALKKLITRRRKEKEEFDIYMQQDAHEFLNFLINHINEIILAERTQSKPAGGKCGFDKLIDQNTLITMKVKKLPMILALHLKRFKYVYKAI